MFRKSHPASLLKALALLLLWTLTLSLAPGLLAQETPAETPSPSPAQAQAPASPEDTPAPAEGAPTPPAEGAPTPPAEGEGQAADPAKPKPTSEMTVLEEFENRASQVRSVDVGKDLVDETFATKDLKRLAICMKYAPLTGLAAQKFADEPPSEFKDKLTMALIDRPWPNDQGAPARARTVPPPDPFLPYAQYIQQRVKGVIDPRSPDQVKTAGSSHEERTAIAHKFDRALIKAGLSSVKGKPSARPRRDGKPGAAADDDEEEGEGAQAGAAGGSSMSLWIGVGAALLLAVAGFFAFRRKG